MTCALISLKERKRIFFFKDIIVVMISVHNRGRIEIEKSRKKRIYWSNTHSYRIQRYTLTLQPARLRPKLSKEKRVVSLTSPPLLPSSPGFRIFTCCCLATNSLPAGEQSFG